VQTVPEQLTKSGSCGFGGGVGVTEGEGLGETEGEGVGDGFTSPPPSLLSLQALSMMPAAAMTDKSLTFMV